MNTTEPWLDDQLREVALLTRAQAAKQWGCSVATIDRMLRDGRLRWVPLGNVRRIPATELRAYIDRNLAHPPPGAAFAPLPAPRRLHRQA